MSRGRSPGEKERLLVWGRAAGRCQYTNCGTRLDQDLISGELGKNFAYLAHNVASSPGGVRGDPKLSHDLADDPDNIVLMCDVHHRVIDDMQMAGTYSVEAVRTMKLASERRIDRLLSNPAAPATHIIRMSATIGDNETAIPLRDCIDAVVPAFTLADDRPINIKLQGMEHKDSDPNYYKVEIGNLRRRFEREVRGRFEAGEMEHLAVFGFAPMPILMELGRLLSDLRAVNVFARHREPAPGWTWPNDGAPLSFETVTGVSGPKTVALKLCISAEIADERIVRSMPDRDVSIWTLHSDRLGTSVLRNENDLAGFRMEVGKILDEIRKQHGENVDLSVFPAVPVACAIEFGRTWQPKAHPAFTVFDEIRREGFVPCHRIT